MTDASARLAASIADRYRLERELGQGGMATVYLARDLKHERAVAIKVLKPELGAVLGAERFLKEIRTTANLQHPHLLALYDSGEADGLLYYVMPFVEGETLRARLVAEPQLSVDETIRIITILAGALDFAHARGVVHRDLKPENILLQAGQPVIADFGIALAVAQAGGERITETGLSLGTPHYMSPEQAAGTHTVDARADQYALGAIAYELLTGEPPHDGATTPIIVARLMTETPRAIRATRPAVPAGVETAILRALEKAPADRFASCGAFADALASGVKAVVHAPVPPLLPEPPGPTSALPVDHTPGAGAKPPQASPVRRLAPIAALVAFVALAIVGVTVALRSGTGGATPQDGEKSLAVLPFTSVGGDTTNTYFAAGIADELTSALTRIPGLRLAGRASAARVKQQGDGAREIGSSLNVEAVLDGSVRRAGERIRVSVELTSAADGRVLWSETYERALEDVFAVQDDITRSIVGALQVRLVGGDAADARTARGGTTNLVAYDYYLRALELYRGRGAGLREAERALMEAVTADPAYAKAHALLASVLLVQTYYGLNVNAADLQGRARIAAQRAVALDDSLADAHTALGYVHIESFEWADAERELRRALALDPRSAETQYRLAQMLMNSGRVRDALIPLEEGNRLDPLYPIAAAYRAWAFALLERYEDGVIEARRAVSLGPDNVSCATILVLALSTAGLHDEAAAASRRLRDMTTDPLRRGWAAWGLTRAGEVDEATAILNQLEALPDGTPNRSHGLVYARLALGDPDGALVALQAAVATAPQNVISDGFIQPFYDPVRKDPRFAAVLQRFSLDVDRLTLPDGGRTK